jgi:hypothetical protein
MDGLTHFFFAMAQGHTLHSKNLVRRLATPTGLAGCGTAAFGRLVTGL